MLQGDEWTPSRWQTRAMAPASRTTRTTSWWLEDAFIARDPCAQAGPIRRGRDAIRPAWIGPTGMPGSRSRSADPGLHSATPVSRQVMHEPTMDQLLDELRDDRDLRPRPRRDAGQAGTVETQRPPTVISLELAIPEQRQQQTAPEDPTTEPDATQEDRVERHMTGQRPEHTETGWTGRYWRQDEPEWGSQMRVDWDGSA